MKRLRMLLSMLLVLLMAVSATGITSAENTPEATPWQADILKLMNPDLAPKATRIRFNGNLEAGEDVERRSYNQELVSSRGDVLNVEFRFALKNGGMGEGQWATVSDLL